MNKNERLIRSALIRRLTASLSVANVLFGSYHLMDTRTDTTNSEPIVYTQTQAETALTVPQPVTSTTQEMNSFQAYPSPLEASVLLGIEDLGMDIIPVDEITSDDQLMVAIGSCAVLFNLVEKVQDQTELFGSMYGQTELLTDPIHHHSDLAINNVQLPVFHFDTADPVGLGVTITTSPDAVPVLVDFVNASMEDVCQRLESVE